MKLNKTIKTLLVAAIVVWGWNAYEYFIPPVHYLNANDQFHVVYTLESACPMLVDELEFVDGKIEVKQATEVIQKCVDRLKRPLFEQALIQEFSRHY